MNEGNIHIQIRLYSHTYINMSWSNLWGAERTGEITPVHVFFFQQKLEQAKLIQKY